MLYNLIDYNINVVIYIISRSHRVLLIVTSVAPYAKLFHAEAFEKSTNRAEENTPLGFARERIAILSLMSTGQSTRDPENQRGTIRGIRLHETA